jgi:predicted MFS family arabinose efflux permease
MLRALRDPGVASVTMISFQLNAIHHVGGVFFPLVARGVGLGLAEIGLARSAYSGINAVGRPLSSPLITRLGAARTSFWVWAVQCGTIACIPLVAIGGLPAFMLLFALSGGLRAVGFTANAIAMAEDIPESRLSRGLTSGLFNAAKDLGNIAGPVIGSTLVSIVGLERMFVVAAILLLLLQVAVTRGVEWSNRQVARAERSVS